MIHTHQALWEAVATGLARRFLGGKPTLVQPASAGYYGEADELGRTRGAGILRRAILANTGFAAISAEIERQWRALGVAEGRIVRMASGVDAEQFRPGTSSVEATLLPRPRVMFTGRLHPQKNLPLLLEAWSEVASRHPASLILVGPGNDRQPLTELAGSLGIADRVQFVGAVDDPADYLRAADVFVLPSVAEGMSNSLLEAMATALPCVVSGIGGNTDLIADGTDRPPGQDRHARGLVADSARAARRPWRSPATGCGGTPADRRRVRPERRRRPLRRPLPPDDRRVMAGVRRLLIPPDPAGLGPPPPRSPRRPIARFRPRGVRLESLSQHLVRVERFVPEQQIIGNHQDPRLAGPDPLHSQHHLDPVRARRVFFQRRQSVQFL